VAYASIAVGAYLFGWRGGLPAGLLTAFLLGPAAYLLGLPNRDTTEAGIVRAAAYIGVGTLLGVLFDRLRDAIGHWKETARRIDERQRQAMVAFARGAEAKDHDTGEHIVRVQLVSQSLALATGIDEAEAERIGWAAMLHDVGKLHVPDAILTKPGPLTTDEWEVMQKHAIWGAEILSVGHSFETARRIARWHHENFDGTGYPDGLDRDQIPLDARIVRISDAFDAMTSNRCYARSRSVEEALEELHRCAGSQFDPELVRLMIDLVRSDRHLVTRLTEVSKPNARFAA
jgi:HD-GYP domain-containing protein (c-di-GMP phosphodiesterase class II)